MLFNFIIIYNRNFLFFKPAGNAGAVVQVFQCAAVAYRAGIAFTGFLFSEIKLPAILAVFDSYIAAVFVGQAAVGVNLNYFAEGSQLRGIENVSYMCFFFLCFINYKCRIL